MTYRGADHQEYTPQEESAESPRDDQAATIMTCSESRQVVGQSGKQNTITSQQPTMVFVGYCNLPPPIPLGDAGELVDNKRTHAFILESHSNRIVVGW